MDTTTFKVEGRLVSVDSEEGKERLKWEQRGYNPNANPFPKMLYKANRLPNGQWSAGESDDNLFSGKDGQAAQFSKTCQMIVQSESEQTRALEAGWRPTQGAAIEFGKDRDNRAGQAAAERAYDLKRMSPKAQEEVAAIEEAAGPLHLEEIPEQPRQKRKYTRKVAANA